MNILYTCDDAYAWLMGISMISLFENNREISELDVYLLGENISDKNKDLLRQTAQRYDRRLSVIDVPALEIPEILISRRWPLSAFTRIFSGELLPEGIKNVLYLDCDTIVDGKIAPLERSMQGRYVFWGVKDCIGSHYRKNIGLNAYDNYVNAGVLLIDLNELRKINVNEQLEGYLKRYAKRISYADQDILNGVFRGRIGILEPQYNVMTITSVYTWEEIEILRKPANYYEKDTLEKAAEEPVIIHYTANMRTIRPWYRNTDHPFAGIFLKYKNISPWRSREREQYRFSGAEARLIRAVQLFPEKAANRILGWIHSQIRPAIQLWKAQRCSKKNNRFWR